MPYNNAQAFLAEVLGTFVFIIIGNGSLCNALLPGTKGHGLGYLGIAVSFGLAVFIALQIVGHISPFFNPAVALGAAVRGDITWNRFLLCTAGELIGSFLAAILVYFIYIPHFQPLALVGEFGNDNELIPTSGEGQHVAVIRQEVKGSARRYASHGNERTTTGIKLQHEKEKWHIFSNFMTSCWSAVKDLETGKSRWVVSSSDLQKVQVEPKSAAKGTIKHSIEVDQEIKLVVFCTRPSSVKYYWIFAPLAEMVGTALLTYGAFTIDDRVKILVTDQPNQDLFFGAMQSLLIGILLIGIILSCGGITGPALNPVKDFTPRIVHWLMPIPGKGSSEWWYAWVPIVGPCAGGVLGALLSDQMRDVTRAKAV